MANRRNEQARSRAPARRRPPTSPGVTPHSPPDDRRAQFWNIVASSHDALLTSALDGTIVTWNAGAQHLYGYDAAEAVGRPVTMLLAPESAAEWRAIIDRIGRAESPDPFDTVCVRKDGVHVDVVWSVSPLADRHGKLVGASAFGHDITTHKRTVAELRRALAQLTESQALARLGSWEWEIPTDTMRWSEELYRLHGVNPAEFRITYENVLELVHPDDRALVRETVGRAYREGGSYVCEHRVVRPDGSIRWWESRGTALTDGDGKALKLFGTVQDVTEQKVAGDALARSRVQLRDFAGRLRSACEKERSLIAREIHDELGQALTALKMDVFSLRNGLPASARARLEPETEEMAALIDTMIDKVRTLAAELRPAVLDSLGLAAAVEWAVQQFARRTGIRCELDLPAEQLRIDADRSIDVFRILQEALANVARHAEASSVHVHLRVTPGELVLEVHDNGRGIRPGEIESTASFGLLGMRERALLWGGEIGIRAVPQGGTCASVCIPLAHDVSEVVA
jgi:PAS domain S-box-containing protein